MKIVATTSLPAVDRPNADRWNAARSRQYLNKSSRLLKWLTSQTILPNTLVGCAKSFFRSPLPLSVFFSLVFSSILFLPLSVLLPAHIEPSIISLILIISKFVTFQNLLTRFKMFLAPLTLHVVVLPLLLHFYIQRHTSCFINCF